MKSVKKVIASAAIIGIVIYGFNFEYLEHFSSLVCNSVVECVDGGNEYSEQLIEELNNLKVSNFISVYVNGNEMDFDDIDFGEDFYNIIIDLINTIESAIDTKRINSILFCQV